NQSRSLKLLNRCLNERLFAMQSMCNIVLSTKRDMNMRIPILFLLLFGILMSNQVAGHEFKVMTYNIYHCEENYNPGHSNIQRVADIINTYKPDFVALQEVDSMTNRTAEFNADVPKDLVQELAKLTGMHGYFAKAIDYSNGGYGEGVLSRWPV